MTELLRSKIFSRFGALVCIIGFFLMSSLLQASHYSECIFMVRVRGVNSGVEYNAKIKSHVMKIRFRVKRVTRAAGFLPSQCNSRLGETYTKTVILPGKKNAAVVRRGRDIRLKFSAGSGMRNDKMVSWENWKLLP